MNHSKNHSNPKRTLHLVTTNHASMVAHPDVVKAITGTLRARGVGMQSREDAIADVQMKVILHLKKHGLVGIDDADARSQCAKLASKIAKNHAASFHRQAKRREQVLVELCEDADAHVDEKSERSSFDRVDEQRLLGIVEEMLEASSAPKLSFMILAAEADGVAHADVSAETGISIQAVRARLFAMRKTFATRLSKKGLEDLALRDKRKPRGD